jgi:hypothetical protein
MATRRAGPATQSSLEAARHLAQEARAVLTSLRGGPLAIARGDLAGDLMDLRAIVKIHLEEVVVQDGAATINNDRPVTPPPHPIVESLPSGSEEEDGSAVLVQRDVAPPPESPMPTSKICNFSNEGRSPMTRDASARSLASPENVGIFARPFLAVVMDPRAAGPHTLVALRALFRLLERGSLATPSSTTHGFHVSLEPLMKGVLACRFEQTDAGADEAVEMAIADLLALLVSIDQRAFLPATLMEAFNTVFVTRNTFVHSPALCYHFEDVLATMVLSTFEDIASTDDTACLILEFLVNQMLHTPLVGGDNLDDAAREAQAAHDATRVLCLRLTRCCLRTGWGHKTDLPPDSLKLSLDAGDKNVPISPSRHHPWEDRSLLSIVQDDLCLSLLMTGQAIWAYHDATSNISPGLISLEVLSEICATLSTLWNTVSLRRHLLPQFEQIFTGFYQRALVLLRKRRNPIDSASFNANLVFDSEVEIILESLVDLLGLHEPGHGSASGDAGALEALFATYDCDMSRSDVASELVVELCRCCGGVINDEGDVMLGVFPNTAASMPEDSVNDTPPASGSVAAPEDQVQYWRQVPAHLKELCAEALVGCMKCLFEEEDAGISDAVAAVAKSEDNVGSNDAAAEDSSLRAVHSRKRIMRKAARAFNEKSKKGIGILVSSGLVPDPPSPMDVAQFLRNGLVVGLDKAAVGMYLGELGKAATAGKSPLIWERDWFHKEVLSAYCSLFRFEGQSLLEGLRMFLAAFRLPGEGQQIDRIIQAFADSCGRVCDESARQKLFSDTPERASDPAFLLSYSIIMLTTDLHNKNIREDRKMSLEAFIRNNTNYGRDITEPGKELPPEFLTGIYESIKEEEIRTEAEGAEGAMTVERWKDVLRGSGGEPAEVPMDVAPVRDDSEVKELVVESLWMPIVSVIGAFWGVVGIDEAALEATASPKASEGPAMLGVQGARLGMDMAIDLLLGTLNMGRLDVFQEVFSCICFYTGLLGEYTTDAVERTWSFVNSVEAQSAVIAIIQTARAAGDHIGAKGWKQVWALLFELRDLKLLCRGKQSILTESDEDFLIEAARRDWVMYMSKGRLGGDANQAGNESKVSSVLGVMGRAFFGGEESLDQHRTRSMDAEDVVRSVHGKEDLVLWDDFAPSDDENENEDESDSEEEALESQARSSSAGARFESQLIHEDMMIHDQNTGSMPVTGLERVEDTIPFQISPRARVRKRLSRACDFAGLVSDSRFMDVRGVEAMLAALSEIVCKQQESEATGESSAASGEDGTPDTGFVMDGASVNTDGLVVSPASEAFAEVLICEIALKNRDRLGVLWQNVLKDHYHKRLGNAALSTVSNSGSETQNAQIPVSPGMEKCVTGFLRICGCAAMREHVGSEVLPSLDLICRRNDDNPGPFATDLGRHVGEGLWRICRNVDGLSLLSDDAWQSLLDLAEWCAAIGGRTELDREGRPSGLASDDPALLSYRSLHLILHAPELKERIPFTAVSSIRAVVIAGERARFPKLNIAGLDLLHTLHSTIESRASPSKEESKDEEKIGSPLTDEFWAERWIPVLDAIAEAGKLSMFTVSIEAGFHLSCFIVCSFLLISPCHLFRTFVSMQFPC